MLSESAREWPRGEVVRPQLSPRSTCFRLPEDTMRVRRDLPESYHVAEQPWSTVHLLAIRSPRG